MNERIQELAERAGFDYDDKAYLINRFAEMLLQECLRIVEHTPAKQDRQWDFIEDCILEAAQDVREHFGVK